MKGARTVDQLQQGARVDIRRSSARLLFFLDPRPVQTNHSSLMEPKSSRPLALTLKTLRVSMAPSGGGANSCPLHPGQANLTCLERIRRRPPKGRARIPAAMCLHVTNETATTRSVETW